MDDAPVLHIYRDPSPAVEPKKPRKKNIKPFSCVTWTGEEKRFFVKNFAAVPNKCLASIMGRSYVAMKNMGRMLELKKLPKQKPGLYTWLIGGTDQYRRHIEVAGCMITYSRYRWEQLHGPVPPGYILSFKDGDTMNDHPDNMELISHAKNLDRNRSQNFEEYSAASHKAWKTKRARQALRDYGMKLR